MIFNYKQCINIFGSHYNLIQALNNGQIYKIKNGLYSYERHPKDLEIFIYEHKGAVFTMESALYYLGISDYVPDTYNVATDKDGTKYKEENVKQYFISNDLIYVGATTILKSGIEIPIYNKERMLIEVIRYKNKLPFDYYKEVIAYYRNHIDEVNFQLVLDYLELFPKKQMITNIIQMEVL